MKRLFLILLPLLAHGCSQKAELFYCDDSSTTYEASALRRPFTGTLLGYEFVDRNGFTIKIDARNSKNYVCEEKVAADQRHERLCASTRKGDIARAFAGCEEL
ncbi:MAG TPA: hypothetical protein VNS79_02315 [Sphingobium sp.]|nr:hypothetical protein [Sphingobium sp.]